MTEHGLQDHGVAGHHLCHGDLLCRLGLLTSVASASLIRDVTKMRTVAVPRGSSASTWQTLPASVRRENARNLVSFNLYKKDFFITISTILCFSSSMWTYEWSRDPYPV